MHMAVIFNTTVWLILFGVYIGRELANEAVGAFTMAALTVFFYVKDEF